MRSLEQNDCFHKWCREIAKHLQANKVMVSMDTVKELVLRNLGNTKLVDNVPGMPADVIAMRSSKYKQVDGELSVADQEAGFVSMNELLGRMEAWAATDLGLNLARDEE